MKSIAILLVTAVAMICLPAENASAQRHGGHGYHHGGRHQGGQARYYRPSGSSFSIGFGTGRSGFYYSSGYPRYSGRGFAPVPYHGFRHAAPRPYYGGGYRGGHYGGYYGGCRRW